MTTKKKIIIGVLILALCGLWFFAGRRVTFLIKCLAAGTGLENNFSNNKTQFLDLVPLLSNATPIEFNFYSRDTIYLTFKDSSIRHAGIFIDSNYSIDSETKTAFHINDNGHLEIIDKDTIQVGNHNWQVQFFGHYKDKKIADLLSYYGWTQQHFEQIVEKVQVLNCYGFVHGERNFALRYKVVSYYSDGLFVCFGHSDGYFDYLYTTQPDSFQWQGRLDHMADNFYSVKQWSF